MSMQQTLYPMSYLPSPNECFENNLQGPESFFLLKIGTKPQAQDKATGEVGSEYQIPHQTTVSNFLPSLF